MKKKILFIHHGYGWGGASICLINLIKKLDPQEYEIKVLLFKKNTIVERKLVENGINVCVAKSVFYNNFYFGFIHSEAGYYKWYQLYPLLKSFLLWILSRYYFAPKELARHEYNIAHLNSSILSDWLAPAKRKGKVIMHIREPFRRGKLDVLNHIFTSQMRKYADYLIAISEDNAYRIGILDKTEVIYDHTDINLKLPQEESYYSKKILYLGGAEYIKGFYLIVGALDYLDEDVKVIFGGSYSLGESQNTLKEILKKLLGYGRRSKNAIRKLKHHPNAVVIGLTYDVQQYLDEVCCLVSPFTRTHFSMPVIEAFSAHKPVIVTDTEGIREVVKPGINGLIVAKENPQALAAAINYMCNNGMVALKMGSNGFKQAQEKYSQINTSKICKIYNSL